MDLKITDVQPILKEPKTSAPRQVGHKDGSFADALREAQANVGVSFSKQDVYKRQDVTLDTQLRKIAEAIEEARMRLSGPDEI